MGIFEFSIPAKVEFGPDSAARLGYYVSAAGKRVLIVSDGILSLSEPLHSVEGILRAKGIDSIVYDAVYPNADSGTADEAAQLARKSRANVVIGLGGARACSAAKIVAFLCENGGEVADYISGREGNGRRVFYVEVPTVFRDVYALSDCAFVTDAADQTNKVLSPRGMGTDMLFVDPSLMAGLPQKTGTSAALDILALSIEGYVSLKVNPLVEPMLLRGIELVFSSLPQYLENPADGSVREKLCAAGLFTSIANAVTGFGIAFALAMGMNGRNRISKSTVTPILLPHVLEYSLSACAPRLAKIARVMGKKTENAPEAYAAAMCIDALKKFRESLGVPLPVRLSQLGLQKDDLAEAAEVALRFEDVNSVPRKASFQGLMEIMEKAF
jgi:alcohol dehydrogenase class IV